MQVQNIPSNLLLYSKRAFNWRLNSSPFLTGDLFADNADLAFFTPRFRQRKMSRRDISASRVVFCPSHKLEEMLELYGSSINASVLILGNSDREFHNLEFRLPTSIKHVFAQNLLNPSQRATVLPIGLENRRLATNGQLGNFSRGLTLAEKQKKILIGPFSNTHPEREVFFSGKIDSSEEVVTLSGRIPPKTYAELSSRFQFIAAPRGNGIDTHRFWEALYRGSLPIVLDNSWSEQIRALEIPHLNVNSWSSLELTALLRRSSSKTIDPNLIPSLWWPFWKSRITTYL